MKKIFILPLILIVTFIDCVAQYEITPIHVSGNPEKTYTLVIVAEGYTLDQLTAFKADARKATDILFNNPCYSSLKANMNVYAISTPSKESGISLIANNPSPSDPIQTSQLKQTFFHIYYQNSFRAYFLDDSSSIKARTVAHELIPFSDNVLILVNEDRGSGRASIDYGVAVSVKPREFNLFDEYIIRHETAHSIAGLADTYSPLREESFNKTTNNNAATVRWKSFLADPAVGINTITSGVYCPNPDCIMKTTNNYFCPVCTHRLEQVVLGKTQRHVTPHRIITKARSDNSFQLSWDRIMGATNYEVVFFDNSTSGLLPQMTIAAPDTSITFQNLNLDPGFGNWIVNIRAYNETYSTRFATRNRVPNKEFYPTIPQPRPIPKATVTKMSPTAVTINCTKDDIATLTLIRLYNDQNVLSEIVSSKNSITLTGLQPDKTYKFSVAAGVIDTEQTEYLSSPFSSLIEFTTSDCNPKLVIPLTVAKKKG